MVSVNKLCKKLNGNIILENVTFEVDDDVIIGVCGKNGAGKTTLIKCLLGIYKTDNGNVFIKEGKRKVIFDCPVYLGNLLVKEYLEYYSLLYENKKLNDETINDILTKINLLDYKEKRISELSYGMNKKLYISTLMLGECSLAIIDEPFNGLDIESIAIVKKIIKQIKEKYGATVMVVSHLLNELKTFCDSYLVVSNHKIYVTEKISSYGRKIRIIYNCNNPIVPMIAPYCDMVQSINQYVCDVVLKSGIKNVDIIKILLENEVEVEEVFNKVDKVI